MDLAGTRAVVTGGSGAVGAAVVEEFARAGADLTVAYHTDEAGARDAAERAREHGVAADVAAADLTDPDAAEQLVDGAAAAGEFATLVDCAGSTTLLPVDEATGEALREEFAVNVAALANVCAPAVDHFGERGGGAVVALASDAGELGTVSAPYAAAKAGVVGYVRALAREVGADGVRVNAVAPGPVDSPMNDEVVESLEERRFRGHRTVDSLLDRYEATPEEVASAVRFLAEHEFVTAEVLHVDGGMNVA